MPAVTVPESPRGEPTATTGAPTCTASDDPSAIAGSGVPASILTTARSVAVSRPMSDAA